MPYYKIKSQNYNGKNCISYKFNNIVTSINNKIYMDIYEPGKRSIQNWLNISSNGLLYLSYTDGRLYFFRNKDDIKLSIDDSKNTLNFIYKGIWEEEDNSEEKVEYDVSITFQYKDYLKLKKILYGNL